MVPLTIIVAATRNNGIGQGSRLPWRLQKEMAYFAKITKQAPSGHINALIMGRKTWESIPKKNRPLVDRVSIVISGNPDYKLYVLPLILFFFHDAIQYFLFDLHFIVSLSKKIHHPS